MTNNQNVLSTDADDGRSSELDDVIIIRDSEESPGSKGHLKNSSKKIDPNDPAHLEGTNDVTGKILELWREYKKLQSYSEMQIQQGSSSDLPENEVRNQLDSFSFDRFQIQ